MHADNPKMTVAEYLTLSDDEAQQVDAGCPRIEGTAMPHIRVTGPHSPAEAETIA
jgi:hypothetical protein